MRASALPASERWIDPLAFSSLVDPAVHGRSGKVFYSGTAAFSVPSHLYILGLNPGGSPIVHWEDTVARNVTIWPLRSPRWSEYCDESWEGAPPGTFGMAPRVLHLIHHLGLDPREVPASNVVFVRTSTEADLAREKKKLLQACWPVHEAVIGELGISTILCFGGTAGRWVRSLLQADELVARFIEHNARKWVSEAHASASGVCVVTLTHPSRADWTNPKSDPSSLVAQVLRR